MSSAWAFCELPAERRSRFASAAIAQAAAISGEHPAARTLPLHWPKELTAWPLLLGGVLVLAQVPSGPRTHAKTSQPLAAGELLLSSLEIRHQQRQLERVREAHARDAPLVDLAHDFELLLARVERREIDRVQLLRELAELQLRARSESARSADSALDLRELGEALAAQTDTRELGTALAQNDLATSRGATDKLAARAASSAPARDRRELTRLRAALRSGLSQAERQRTQRMAEARRTLDSLEREREHAAEQPAQSTAQREARQRRADDALNRERASRQRERELEHLERELSQAAAASPNTADQTQRALESASKTLERMQDEQEHDRAIERMQDRIAELQQQLTDAEARAQSGEQRGSTDEARAERLTLEQFRAKPRQLQPGQSSDDKPADGAAPSGTLTSPPQRDQALDPAARELKLQRMTSEPGPSHEGRPERGKATASGSADVDVAVAGVMGQGPTRRSVIYDAAARGFSTLGYQKVHADYAQHAEAELEREPLPVGYRRFVHRYFELIQPAEDTHE